MCVCVCARARVCVCVCVCVRACVCVAYTRRASIVCAAKPAQWSHRQCPLNPRWLLCYYRSCRRDRRAGRRQQAGVRVPPVRIAHNTLHLPAPRASCLAPRAPLPFAACTLRPGLPILYPGVPLLTTASCHRRYCAPSNNTDSASWKTLCGCVATLVLTHPACPSKQGTYDCLRVPGRQQTTPHNQPPRPKAQ